MFPLLARPPSLTPLLLPLKSTRLLQAVHQHPLVVVPQPLQAEDLLHLQAEVHPLPLVVAMYQLPQDVDPPRHQVEVLPQLLLEAMFLHPLLVVLLHPLVVEALQLPQAAVALLLLQVEADPQLLLVEVVLQHHPGVADLLRLLVEEAHLRHQVVVAHPLLLVEADHQHRQVEVAHPLLQVEADPQHRQVEVAHQHHQVEVDLQRHPDEVVPLLQELEVLQDHQEGALQDEVLLVVDPLVEVLVAHPVAVEFEAVAPEVPSLRSQSSIQARK